MKNERKITNTVTKKTNAKKGNIKKQNKSIKKALDNNNKSTLKPPEFPEAIVEVIINKIISYVVRQTTVKEVYTHMGKKCFLYLKDLINPYLSTEYINYEDGLDDIELQRSKMNYKTVVTEKVNTWEYFPEPNTPGIDRYSSFAAKLISFKHDNEDIKDDLKNMELKDLIMKRKSSLIKTDLIVSEAVEFNKKEKKEKKEVKKNIKEKRKKRKKSKEKEEEKEKEKEKKIIEEKILELPNEDLPKEKYENKYRLINENEENNELRKEREYLIKKRLELKAIQDLQDKKDKLKRFQNRLQKNFDGSKQTFDSEGKIMQIHSPQVENLMNEFNFVKIQNNIALPKKERRRSTISNITKMQISRLTKNKINEINEKKNWDKLPQEIKDIFIYIKDVLFPKWQKKAFMRYSVDNQETNKQNNLEEKKNYSGNKPFKVFFGPFLKKYVFKGNVIRNPVDIARNNMIYYRHENLKRKMLNPSGSNFNLMKPETGVVIEDKNKRKKEIKDGGFEYIKKYNKPSMYEFSKLVMETSNLNSLNSRALSSGLIESKVNEINEIKNRNKYNELNKDDYNGYIFEFSDNVNPLFQDALSLNDKQKSTEDNENKNTNEIKEENNYKDKNIFRAMEEGYLKSKYNSMNLMNLQKSIQLKNNIHNLYSYFEDDTPINQINKNKKNTIEFERISKNYSAMRRRKIINNRIINEAPLPNIKVHRINVNKSEIREMKNKIKGRKMLNKFNYGILKDKRWGEDDGSKKKKNFGFEKKNSLKSNDDINNLLKRTGENIIIKEENNNKIKRGLFKSASAENIF